MLDWLKRLAGVTRPSLVLLPRSADDPRHTGEYHLLGKYLEERFANRVILSFSEIEDLLGFALPAHARELQAWWGSTVLQSSQSDAWLGAGRTASVNLLSRSVVFERDAALDSPSGRT